MTGAAWLVVAGAGGLAAGVLGAVTMLARARRGATPFDLPDKRRLHDAPTPRGGGIGIVVAAAFGLLVGLFACGTGERGTLSSLVLCWALPNGLIGIVDDHQSLSPRTKLIAQAIAASAAVALGLHIDAIVIPPFGAIELGIVAPMFCVLWLVWMANVFNFMDGMDALAGECGTAFFAGLAGFALYRGATGHAALAVCIAGAQIGFLRYNMPPAKIFMGDGGSLCSGALMGGIALSLARPEVASVPLAATALIFSAFVFDATFTVVRRAMRGLALRPHRTHFYQRLVIAGLRQDLVRWLYLGITAMGLVGSIAMVCATTSLQIVCLAIVAGMVLGVVVLTRVVERRTRSRR